MADLDMTTGRIGPQLKVWWVPQVPMKPFVVFLDSFAEAKVALETLAAYDSFQLANEVRSDFSNAGGLCIWDEDAEPNEQGEHWCDWEDEDGQSIDDLSLAECVELDREFYNRTLMNVAR